jgi:hypothetical protein
MQGSDHMHGCYGGTAALLSVADWVASPSWDGRLGLAVATDIAVYPEGSPARPTGDTLAVAAVRLGDCLWQLLVVELMLSRCCQGTNSILLPVCKQQQ